MRFKNEDRILDEYEAKIVMLISEKYDLGLAVNMFTCDVLDGLSAGWAKMSQEDKEYIAYIASKSSETPENFCDIKLKAAWDTSNFGQTVKTFYFEDDTHTGVGIVTTTKGETWAIITELKENGTLFCKHSKKYPIKKQEKEENK